MFLEASKLKEVIHHLSVIMFTFTDIVEKIAGRIQSARHEQSEHHIHCFQMPALFDAGKCGIMDQRVKQIHS